jgi:hypothetical protein
MFALTPERGDGTMTNSQPRSSLLVDVAAMLSVFGALAALYLPLVVG